MFNKIVIDCGDIYLEDGRVKSKGKVVYKVKHNKLTVTKNSIVMNGFTVTGNNIAFMSGDTANFSFGNFGVIGSIRGNNNVIYGGNVGNVVVNGKVINNTFENNFKMTDEEEVFLDLECSNLEKIKIDGSGSVEVNDCMSENCSFIISGSGKIKVNLDSLINVQMKVSGSGDIKGNCKIKQLNCNLSGSGNISGFKVENGIANVSGSGNISLSSSNPKNIMKSVSGSGKVKITKE